MPLQSTVLQVFEGSEITRGTTSPILADEELNKSKAKLMHREILSTLRAHGFHRTRHDSGRRPSLYIFHIPVKPGVNWLQKLRRYFAVLNICFVILKWVLSSYDEI